MKCSECLFFHPLKHNYTQKEGFEESYCCDALLHAKDRKSSEKPWIQQVSLDGWCEMFAKRLYK